MSLSFSSYRLCRRTLTLIALCRTLSQIKDAIPAHLFVRDTPRSLMYLVRDLILAAAWWKAALYIDPYFKSQAVTDVITPVGGEVARWASWLA